MDYDEMKDYIFNMWANWKTAYSLTQKEIDNLPTVEYPIPSSVI